MSGAVLAVHSMALECIVRWRLLWASCLRSPVVGLGNHGLRGSIWTALRTSELISMRHAAFREMASEVDHIVAVCNWVHDVLLLNYIPAAKLSISRHGINWAADTIAPVPSSTHRPRDEMRLAFVGRLDTTKGLHVLIKAFRTAPSNISLDVYGVVQNSANAAYRKEMLDLASGDPRISFRKPMGTHEVFFHLPQYDFLAVPSQWIETGPLVALEAFAAGIPVIGWNLGGIAEIVRDGVDGLLIEPDSIMGWSATLRRVAEDAKLRAQLKAGVRPPRTSQEVAREMLTLYESLLRSPSPRQTVHTA